MGLPKRLSAISGKIRPIVRVRWVTSWRAAAWGVYPCAAITACTRSRTTRRTLGCPLITRETVERETPANLAISSIVNCDISTPLHLLTVGHLLLAKIWCTIGLGIALIPLGSLS